MPKNPGGGVEHAVSTGHSIPRRAGEPVRRIASSGRVLAPFRKAAVSNRDLGMAYSQVADEGRAFELLKAADDPPALAELAHLYDLRSDENRAASLYERALRADPSQIEAANNLGAILLKRGRGDEAMRL